MVKREAKSIIVPEMGFIFSAIGKNASTHLCLALQHSYGPKRWNFITKKDYHKYPNYSVYAVVRNPYTRLMSCYEFMKTSRYPQLNKFVKYTGFKDFVQKVCGTPDELCDKHYMSQYALLSWNKKFLPTRVWKLEDGLEDIKKVMGVPDWKGHENPTQKLEQYFDDDLATSCYNRFKQDFEAFNYGTAVPI